MSERGGGLILTTTRACRDQFLNFPHAGPSGRILSIGKAGLDTGASLDQEGRPACKPTDIRGR